MDTMLTIEESKERIRLGFEEFINKNNADVIDRFIAPNYIGYFAGLPDVHGPEGFKQLMAMWHNAFPDIEVTIHDVVAENDKIAVRSSYKATHTGDFMGIPATGRKVEFISMDIFQVEDNLAVKQWSLNDTLTMMMQLGVIPAPGQ